MTRPIPCLLALVALAAGETQARAQAVAPSPDEVVRRLAEGRAIHLRGRTFDPLEESFPAATAEPPVSGHERIFLAQFHHDLTPAEQQELERAGVRLIDYIPSHAYVGRAEAPAVAALRSSPLLRWLDTFRGRYKLAPELASTAWTSGVYLDLRLFPDENPIDLLARLQAIEGAIALTLVHGEAREGATLRVRVPAGRLHPFVELAAEDRSVWTVQPWVPPVALNENSIWVIQNYDTVNKTNYALSATMWNHGITGTGQTPAVADTGLDDDMCFFRSSNSASEVTPAQTLALPGTGTVDPSKKVAAYYVMPNATAYDGNTSCNGIPESWHGTHVTGSILGDNWSDPSSPMSGGHDNGDGMAPNARVIFQDAGNEGSGCLDGLGNDYNLIWKQAYDAGARIHSNSWGSAVSGAYTSDAQTIDRIVYKYEDLLTLFANGNSGPGSQTVGSPATAKDCLAVGALLNGSTGANSLASFSSRGPTADGRRKPDVAAPGDSINSASGDSSHTSNNCGTKTLSGTSMATPTTAGGATLLRQYFTDGFYPTGLETPADAVGPSAALMKAALINGAVDVAGTTQASMLNNLSPDHNQGWGRIELDNVAFFATPTRDTRRTRVWDKWNATGLATGNVDDLPLAVSAGKPLKVTLVWTDPPGSGASAVALVNNLDLEVLDPANTVYRGNVFAGGHSVTGGAADLINTVEEVFLPAPVSGTWTLRVKASAVPGAPTIPGSNRQGYALVATYGDCGGALNPPPSAVTATDNATSGIALTWSAVSGVPRYQIYRAAGSCSAPVTAFHYLGQSTSPSFTDTLVQGGYTYAYRVRTATDCSEGPLSACATATYSGNCTLAPAFAGLISATNDTATSTCDALLGWTAGASSCPLETGVSYDVYRATTPYFVPGPATILAPGTTATTYHDSAVAPNTTYYYSVRAEDSTTANGGPANGGNVDPNQVVRSVTPTSAASYPGTWSDDGGDTTARLVLDAPWRVSQQQNHSAAGLLAYHAGPDGTTYPSNTCAAATTAPIPLQAGQVPILSYWARYDLEYQWDGVVVEVSSNGGGSWSTLNPTPAYPDTLAQTQNPPVNACGYAASQAAFTGPNPNGALSAWTQYTHNLAAFAGQTVQIRWRFTSDPGAEFGGFYVDDISITKAMSPASCGADLRYASSALSDACSGGGAGTANGTLDAGEDATVPVSLQNIGDTTASAITATLAASTPGVVITRSTATFADTASGVVQSSAAPHFGVWVAPSVPCGTPIPLTLHIVAAQGTWDRTFQLKVGSGSPGCTQTVCTTALPVENGTAAGRLLAAKGAGTALDLSFSVSCHSTDATVFWGEHTGHLPGLSWTHATCGFGTGGTATFDPGTPAAGALVYFVVVPTNGSNAGSYGKTSSGAERLAVSGLGACDPPQLLGGTCP
jgi:hypothetical protein